MHFQSFRFLSGPNVYSHEPVLVGRLALEEYSDTLTDSLGGFNSDLCSRLPGLREHFCGLGYEGGFLERLQEGTLLGHVLEHAAIELSQAAGARANHGKTRFAGEAGVYNVILETRCERTTRFLLETALQLIQAVLQHIEFDLEQKLAEARRIASEAALGPSSRAIVEAAERRNIPWRRLDDQSLIQLGWGKHRQMIEASITSNTSCVAVDIVGNKDLTKRLLSESCIPTPGGGVARSIAEALELFQAAAGPVAVKPHDGHQGKAVTLNVDTEGRLERAYQEAAAASHMVVVEPMLTGNDYRVLVVNGQVVAASQRIPAGVTGDGISTIAELVERENCREDRGDGHEKPLTRIDAGSALTQSLREKGLSLETVPAKGERIRLRDTANLSTGGEAIDVTGEIHPDVARVCVRAARVVGLDVCGVDLVAGAIDRPLTKGEGIIELNAAPGLRMHHFPSRGQPRDAGEAIVQSLFPGNRNGRIPVTAVTGTNGKTTVTRMIGHVLNFRGSTVGMTTTDGIYINNQCIAEGDMTGPQSAWAVLSDPSVECAVLETARGGILRRGLGFDWADVGVLTNIQVDHLGQDGIESEDDLLWVKSLVAERVREGGTIVLNADDPRLVTLPERRKVNAHLKRLVYFTLGEPQGVVHEHLARGGAAYFVRDGWLIEGQDQSEYWIIRIADLAITIDGLAEFQTANVLAATAACRALGVPRQTIAAALRTFESRHNFGRANLFRSDRAFVMLDYGHNPAAFEAVCHLAARWKGHKSIGVIGVPGDRNDDVIRAAGRAAGRGFDRIIIREDSDLRGRKPGEVAALLREAVLAEDPHATCTTILSEGEAALAALDGLNDGELLVIFHEKATPIIHMLKERGAVPVSGFDTVPGREPVLWSAAEDRVPQYSD